MTYKEFMEWAEREHPFLKSLGIYVGSYSWEPHYSGCYQDEEGNWYYYDHALGKISLEPSGTMMSEEECFDRLKSDVENIDKRIAEWKRTATYEKFMEWAESQDLHLEGLGIYPNEYSYGPYTHGCYQDKDGNWYYFTNDERTSLEPRGMMKSEGECFYALTNATVCEIREKKWVMEHKDQYKKPWDKKRGE